VNTESEVQVIEQSTGRSLQKGLLAGLVEAGVETAAKYEYVAVPLLVIGSVAAITCVVRRRIKKYHQRITFVKVYNL
jgi:hypothetical protein